VLARQVPCLIFLSNFFFFEYLFSEKIILEKKSQFFLFCFVFDTGSPYVTQAGLKLMIPPKWALNSGLCTHKAGTLPVEPHLQFILL
jgi:hypothetical protein